VGYLRLIGILCFWLPVAVSAVTMEEHEQIVAGINKVVAGLEVTDLQDSPIPGLVQVTAGAEVFYTTLDGRYLLYGALLDLTQDKKTWNITEQHRNKARKSIIGALNSDDMIVFASTAKQHKGHVTVFTDIDCGYCRKLHQEMPKINSLGVEVRYVAFPRQGLGSNSFKKAVSVWCSEDPKAMMTLAKNGATIPEQHCDNNPVAKQFKLGRELGIKGTPTLIFANGAMVPSYLAADKLVNEVELNS